MGPNGARKQDSLCWRWPAVIYLTNLSVFKGLRLFIIFVFRPWNDNEIGIYYSHFLNELVILDISLVLFHFRRDENAQKHEEFESKCTETRGI
jgi:hypothetical protein